MEYLAHLFTYDFLSRFTASVGAPVGAAAGVGTGTQLAATRSSPNPTCKTTQNYYNFILKNKYNYPNKYNFMDQGTLGLSDVVDQINHM